MKWSPQQTSGDTAAAIHGATFGGWLHTVLGDHDSYRIVEIRNLATEDVGFTGSAPYVAWQAIDTCGDLGGRDATCAITAAGRGASGHDWTREDVSLARYDSGVRVERVDQNEPLDRPTLRAAMRALSSPNAALWYADQYDLDANGDHLADRVEMLSAGE